jgi:hypothetical protein
MSRDDRDDRRLRTQVSIQGEGSLNDLDKVRWRDLQDREQRAERRRESEQRDEVEQLRVQLWSEIGKLRNEIEQRHEASVEAAGTFVAETVDKALDKTELAARDLQRDLFTLVERRFAELGARLDVMSGTPAAKKAFRFANEPAPENEPVDLPGGFLQRKTTLN